MGRKKKDKGRLFCWKVHADCSLGPVTFWGDVLRACPRDRRMLHSRMLVWLCLSLLPLGALLLLAPASSQASWQATQARPSARRCSADRDPAFGLAELGTASNQSKRPTAVLESALKKFLIDKEERKLKIILATSRASCISQTICQFCSNRPQISQDGCRPSHEEAGCP